MSWNKIYKLFCKVSNFLEFRLFFRVTMIKAITLLHGVDSNDKTEN